MGDNVTQRERQVLDAINKDDIVNAKLISKRCGITRDNASSILRRLYYKKRISQIERGLYVRLKNMWNEKYIDEINEEIKDNNDEPYNTNASMVYDILDGLGENIISVGYEEKEDLYCFECNDNFFSVSTKDIFKFGLKQIINGKTNIPIEPIEPTT